jgi:hypothetical protein
METLELSILDNAKERVRGDNVSRACRGRSACPAFAETAGCEAGDGNEHDGQRAGLGDGGFEWRGA